MRIKPSLVSLPHYRLKVTSLSWVEAILSNSGCHKDRFAFLLELTVYLALTLVIVMYAVKTERLSEL